MVVFTSFSNVASSVTVAPRYLNCVTFYSLSLPTFADESLLLWADVTITLLFSTLISIPYVFVALCTLSVIFLSSLVLPAIKSMWSAKQRLLISYPPTDTVAVKASDMICFRYKLNKHHEMRTLVYSYWCCKALHNVVVKQDSATCIGVQFFYKTYQCGTDIMLLHCQPKCFLPHISVHILH